MLRSVTVLSLLVAIHAPGLAKAQPVLYVDDDATGANDGSSWCDGFVFLQDALALAESLNNDPDSTNHITEIRVAQGTYKPDQGANQTSGDRTATFQLPSGVAIRGGYAGGCGAPNPDDRDIAPSASTMFGAMILSATRRLMAGR